MNEITLPAPAKKRLVHEPWFAVFVPALIGAGIVFLSIRKLEFYGTALFFGLPILVSFLSAFCYGFRRKVRFRSAYGMSVVSLAALGMMIIVFAMDGLICLVMAFPLAALLAVGGASLGRIAGQAATGKASSLLPLILIFLLPSLVGFEYQHRSRAPLRSVSTSVEIDGPVGEVWHSVIAFSRIEAEPDGVFRLGIAYPIEATIEGTGVGAVRYCKFCTGDFVEPITVWDENKLLAFDVRTMPPPMKEFSLYEHIDPPHLHGHMASEKGQFRLEEKDGKVVLEGTTWYRHEMWPQWYWIPITDQIIHKIHHRVLHHIKTSVEKTPPAAE